MSRLILTPEEAIDLLPEGDTIHNFADGGLILLGVDYSRDEAIKAIREAVQVEIGGDGCKAMRHPLVVWNAEDKYTFFEADMDKVAALEAARGE